MMNAYAYGFGAFSGSVSVSPDGSCANFTGPAPISSTRWIGLGSAADPLASVLIVYLPLAGHTKPNA